MIEADDDEVEFLEDRSLPDFARMLMMSGSISGGSGTTNASTTRDDAAASEGTNDDTRAGGTNGNNNDYTDTETGNNNNSSRNNNNNHVMDLQIHAIVGDGSGGPITFANPTNGITGGLFGGFGSAASSSRRR